MNILVWGFLCLALSLSSGLWLSERANAQVLDAAESIKALEKTIKPALEQATDWSMKAGLGFVSASAFYALVVRVIKL